MIASDMKISIIGILRPAPRMTVNSGIVAPFRQGVWPDARRGRGKKNSTKNIFSRAEPENLNKTRAG
jgi:hypothetical protein